MSFPQSPLTCSPTSLTRRVFDLFVIVAIAGGLLGLAWNLASERGRKAAAMLAASSPGTPLPETLERPLLIPLEKSGMVLTREHVDGPAEQALAALDQRCREVLATDDEWVLSLAVSPEEQQLLDSLVLAEPLPGPHAPLASSAQLFPLHRPAGRAGVRERVTYGARLALIITPPEITPPEITPPVAPSAREPKQPAPFQAEAGSGAAAGRRLICWGFIVSDGAGGHTVWFARPRDKLARSVSQKGHVP